MKKILLTLALAVLASTAFGQAKKPIIMIVPSDNFCFQHGYMNEFDNMGTTVRIPDYDRALLEDSNLNLAIIKLGEMMTERGFPLKDLAASLRTLKTQSAQDAVRTSEDGYALAESPLDKLKKTANADIWMQLGYTINKTGPKQSLTFTLQGLDAYTNKQIAAASGTGPQTFTVEVPVLLEEAVISYIDGFNNQLQMHFDDLFTNGREVAMELRAWDNGEVNFFDEYNGEELGFLIEYWMDDNTVNGRYSTVASERNYIIFEQVRIPLENERGTPIDLRRWANNLRTYLNREYGISARLETIGLGKVIIIVGGK